MVGSSGVEAVFNLMQDAKVDFYSNLTNTSAKVTLNWASTTAAAGPVEVNTVNNEKVLACPASALKQIVIPNDGKIYVLGQNNQAFYVTESGQYGLTHFMNPLPN